MLQPVNISPPEVLVKACSDGIRVGLQLANVLGLDRPVPGVVREVTAGCFPRDSASENTGGGMLGQ